VTDLTIIYLTANRLLDAWVEYHADVLRCAAGQHPIVAISRRPVEGFTANLLDDTPISYTNVYRQLLRGARVAETEYVAMAEDDTLYPPGHYDAYRPEPDAVAYNENRWGLYTWTGVYSRRNRITNAVLIAPRAYLIDALEERFSRCSEAMLERWAGEVGRPKLERGLGVTIRRSVLFQTDAPVVQLAHPDGLESAARHRRKKLGHDPTDTLPYWGHSSEILRHYA